jgi:hypothetical protein
MNPRWRNFLLKFILNERTQEICWSTSIFNAPRTNQPTLQQPNPTNKFFIYLIHLEIFSMNIWNYFSKVSLKFWIFPIIWTHSFVQREIENFWFEYKPSDKKLSITFPTDTLPRIAMGEVSYNRYLTNKEVSFLSEINILSAAVSMFWCTCF